MSHQIRFFLCEEMRAEVEREVRRVDSKIVTSHSTDRSTIQFSESAGGDNTQGRLWTDGDDLADYDALCRGIKRGASYDRESGLWVKRSSRSLFDSWHEDKKASLAALVERNRKFAIEVLGGRLPK